MGYERVGVCQKDVWRKLNDENTTQYEHSQLQGSMHWGKVCWKFLGLEKSLKKQIFFIQSHSKNTSHRGSYLTYLEEMWENVRTGWKIHKKCLSKMIAEISQ